jgi:hypothetical protein
MFEVKKILYKLHHWANYNTAWYWLADVRNLPIKIWSDNYNIADPFLSKSGIWSDNYNIADPFLSKSGICSDNYNTADPFL